MQTKSTSLQISILQVCGLKWSNDDRELASGGNDNQVAITKLFFFFFPRSCSILLLSSMFQSMANLVACW